MRVKIRYSKLLYREEFKFGKICPQFSHNKPDLPAILQSDLIITNTIKFSELRWVFLYL